jgi:hypothetical protein
MDNPVDNMSTNIRIKTVGEKIQGMLLSYAGIAFIISAIGCMFILIINLSKMNIKAFETENNYIDANQLMNYYASIFFMPVFLFIIIIFTSIIGSLLLKAGGAIYKINIPEKDYTLVSSMLEKNNEQGINDYIRLNSLSGFTGFFTKIGLTGLPLATISLTIIFTLLSIGNDKFFDLAKLTLGAFIGSYVQKSSSSNSER